MNIHRFFSICFLFGLIFALTAHSAENNPDGGEDAGPTTPAEALIKWVEQNDKLTDETRAEIRQLQRSGHKDKTMDGDDLIVQGLRIITPDFDRALQALNNEKADKAAKLLKPALSSQNPFLASNARYFLARAKMLQENYQKAADLLQPLTKQKASHTLNKGQVLFHLGVCRFHILQRKKALQTLTHFINHYPEAPEGQRQRAQKMAKKLMLYREGGLQEVHDLMQYSRRRLGRARTGDNTQKHQQRIVKVLNKIIEKASKSKGKGKGGGSGSGMSGRGMATGSGSAPSGNAASSPANQSSLPGGASSMGALSRVVKGRPGQNWGELPPKEREKVLSKLQSKLPNRYRDLVEQYYKSLQESE